MTAQFLGFEEPNRWMTSGGLGTMGYGFPAALGVQVAHPKALVIDVAGEASFMMVLQEMATAFDNGVLLTLSAGYGFNEPFLATFRDRI